MSDATGPHLAPSKVPQINTMALGDIGYALRAGLRDFRRKPMMGLFFANVAVMGGYLIYVLLFLWHLEWLAIPLTFGFPLIGPFLVVGLYEVSRRLEAGQTEWKRNDIFGVIWRQRARQLPLMSWVIIVYYLFWSFFRAYALRAVSRALRPDQRHLVLRLPAGARGAADAAGGPASARSLPLSCSC
jgi:uncharacterized membrane protein